MTSHSIRSDTAIFSRTASKAATPSGNTFEGDLGILTRAAAPREAILTSDLKPATYWITNPANAVRGDVAAGSEGMGFWYNLSPHPTGPSADQTIWPRRTPLVAFAGNVAHSNEDNGLFVDIERNPPGVSEAPNYDPPVIADFKTFTSYKNRRRGAWLRGTKLRLTHAAIADNSIGVTFAGSDAVLQDSLVVGESGNERGRRNRSKRTSRSEDLNFTTAASALSARASSTSHRIYGDERAPSARFNIRRSLPIRRTTQAR